MALGNKAGQGAVASNHTVAPAARGVASGAAPGGVDMHLKPYRPPHGRSLIEFMVALTVLALLATLGLPNLQGWWRHRAVLMHAEAFRSAARLSRALALERQAVVTLCARQADTAGRAPACAAAGRDWSQGWLAFVDSGERGRVDGPDRILHVQLPPQPAGRVVSTARYISFQPTGVSLSAASRFTFLPLGAPPGALAATGDLLVCVNKPGRARIVDADAC